MTPQVGVHWEQRLAAPPTGPKQRTREPRDSGPKRLDRPDKRDSVPEWPRDSGPKQQIC